MNKCKKNVVIVGFTDIERNCISTPSFMEPYYYSQKTHYVSSIKEASRYQGYMLIIDNSKNESIVELDKKYRKIFNKYVKVIIYNEEYEEFVDYGNKWFKYEMIGRSLFDDLSYGWGEEWDDYNHRVTHEMIEPIKMNKNKKEKLDILYNYTKRYKTRKTSEIVKDLNINARTIQRYMFDLNKIYHNIGYDYSLNEWYFC